MKQELSLQNNTPFINFGNLNSRKYAVSIKYIDKEEQKPSKRIDYEAEVIISSNQNEYFFNISKENIWFNQHEPDLINEMIANELCKTLYPVRVMTNDKGEFLGIANFNHIVNSRWHRNKFRATEKYTTEIVKKFYQAFEKNLESKALFEKSMQYDWFWNLFFHPKYIDYGNEHSIQTNLHLAVIPYEYPIPFTGKQTINTEITEYHSVEIHFKSDETEAHSYFVPKNSKTEQVFMKLNVYFDLDIYYLLPMHTRAYFEVYAKDAEGKEIPIKRVEFTQYQEETEKNKTAPPERRSPFLVYDGDEDEEIYKTYEGKNYTYHEWVKFEEEQYKIYKEKQKKKRFWDFLG